MTLPTNSVYEFGEFRLDPRRRLLTRLNGEPVPLTAKAFDALVYFVEHAGETVTRASLTATLWPSTIVEENNLSQAISVLRRTLGAECVATVTRRGYQFTPQVRIVTDAAATSVSSIAAPRVAPPRAGRTLVAAAAAAVLLVGVAIALVRAPQDRAATGALNGYAFIKLTEFEGAEEHAAISRDGRLAAFLRERDGTWDVWIGQIGTGEFRNLTSGSVPELRNPAVRTLGFSPEGSNVVMWTRTSSGADSGLVDGGWVVPALGEGGLRPFFNGVAELDWSPDGARIVYHTAAPGDPLFVADTEDRAGGRQIHVAPAGMHCHFPLWALDGLYIYFVQGSVPDEMDLWRIAAGGGTPERLTYHDSRVSFPVQLDHDTLLYLATVEDGTGPWLHALDLKRRESHRVNTGGQAYTSIAASANGRRLVATAVRPSASLWSATLGSGIVSADDVAQIDVDTPRAASPRLGPRFMAYRAPKAGVDGLWQLVDGVSSELWSDPEGRVLAGPALAPDGRQLAFSVQRRTGVQLLVVSTDGRSVRRIAATLDVRGSPSWSPDGAWLAIAALDAGIPRLFKVPIDDGAPVRLGDAYALDPVWSPSGNFLVFSSADVGTNFTVGAVNADGTPREVVELVLSRGPRRFGFLNDDELVVLRGDLTHKEFWAVNLVTGREQQLTSLGRGPTINDFDVSKDGREIVFDRVRDESDIMLIELSD